MNRLTTKSKLKVFIVIGFVLVLVAYFALVMAVLGTGAVSQNDQVIYLPAILQNRCLESSCNDDPIHEPEVTP